MSRRTLSLPRCLLLVVLWSIAAATNTFAQQSAFTYQGRLLDGGTPAAGTFDMQFKLYDVNGDLTGLPDTVTNSSVNVAGGIFSVQLDFGAKAFPGAPRFLEISVRRNASEPYTKLSPRQQFTSSPYALRASSAGVADKLTGVLGAEDGGTGLSNAPTDEGQFLRSSSAGAWSIAPLNANDIPSLDAAKITSGVIAIARGGTGSTTQNFVDLSTNQSNIGGNKAFSGILSGNGSGLTNVPGTLQWQVVAGTSQQAQPNTGYAVTNANRVTITLPAAPRVGDVVRVLGQGAGGWTIAQNAGQSILAPTLNEMNWTPHEGNAAWWSVASSTDGRKLVAGVNGGLLYTSTDGGVTWTVSDAPNRRWFSVASSADGTRLVAVALNDFIYISQNSGESWLPVESRRNWYSVASSADGKKLVAVAFLDQIYTSVDSGANWQARTIAREWHSVASSADGTKLVAVVGNNGRIYTSGNSGLTWSPNEMNRIWTGVASSADGSKLVAVAQSGQIYTSTDSGVNWTPHESSRNWSAVNSSADGSKLVAVVRGGQIYTSSDSGMTWTPHESTRNWLSVASSADGNNLVAVADGDRIYTSKVTTTPGTAGSLKGTQSSAIELVYMSSGQFFLLSHEGTINAN